MEELNEIEIYNYDLSELEVVFGPTHDGLEVKEHFKITDDLKADWVIKTIKKEEAEAARLCDTINQEIEILKAKAEKATKKAECGYLKKLLCDYFESLPVEQLKATKTQMSYKLPNGSLVYKPESEDIAREDNDIIMALAASEKNEFIKTKLSLDWAALKPLVEFRTEVLDLNNEIVDGLIVIDGVICQEADDQPLKDEYLAAGDLSIYENVPVLKGTNVVLSGIKLGVKPASFSVKVN